MHNYPFPDAHGRSTSGDQRDRYAVRDRHGSTKVSPAERHSAPKERTVTMKVSEGFSSVKVTTKTR